MQEILKLLQDFLKDSITAAEFADRYMDFWKAFREEQFATINAQPGLAQTIKGLEGDFLAGQISEDAYLSRLQALYDGVPGWRVKPGSEADRILSHLFVESDAYESDPEQRATYQIDEVALRSEVKKALEVLSGDQVSR